MAGFNRGDNGFQQTCRTCTPAAQVAIRHTIDEGSKISRDLTARYANWPAPQSLKPSGSDLSPPLTVLKEEG